jgi:hypothetical protein
MMCHGEVLFFAIDKLCRRLFCRVNGTPAFRAFGSTQLACQSSNLVDGTFVVYLIRVSNSLKNLDKVGQELIFPGVKQSHEAEMTHQ